ncbi:MAG: alpha/beta hydrolase, partial [Pseudomonadota bacterium]
RPVERYVPINLPHPAVARRGMWRGGQMLKSWYITFFQLPALPEAGILAGEARKIAEAFRGDAGHPENFSDAVVDAYRRNALRPGGMRAMINYYRANYVELAAGRTLVGEERSDTPTLMIWGAEDRYISAHLTEGTDAYMSDFKLLKLPGISHWAQQDAPEAVNAALADWLPR